MSRRFVPYQVHRYRENFVFSWLGSIFVHILLFSILFILPVPYSNTPPSITLEMWEPEELEFSPTIQSEVTEKEDTIYTGQLSYVTSRYRDLKYHPQAKTSTIQPNKPTKAIAPLSNPTHRPVSANTTTSSQDTITIPTDDSLEAEVLRDDELDPLPSTEYKEDYIPDDTEILGPELTNILEGEGSSQWLGETLMNLHLAQRILITTPDLNFLTDEGFTSNIKVVRIRLSIFPDGTVSDVSVIFPGTGNPELDRRLRLTFAQVVFNDVREYGRDVETGTIVLNFKG